MIGIRSMVPYRKQFRRPENSMNRYPVRCSSEGDPVRGQSDIKGCQLFSQTEGGWRRGKRGGWKGRLRRHVGSPGVSLCVIGEWRVFICRETERERERERERGRILYMDFNETSVITYYCTYGWDGRWEDLKRAQLFIHLKTTSGWLQEHPCNAPRQKSHYS